MYIENVERNPQSQPNKYLGKAIRETLYIQEKVLCFAIRHTLYVINDPFKGVSVHILIDLPYIKVSEYML